MSKKWRRIIAIIMTLILIFLIITVLGGDGSSINSAEIGQGYGV